MSNIRIDKQKALKKWAPVLENMGVIGEEKLDWMSEYAEFHAINENAYLNAGVAGMGNVVSPQPSLWAGSTIGSDWSGNGGTLGSGDLGQNLLPVAMKIAAQTIGLDLVAVKPSPGPKIDLLYIDFQYDDLQGNDTRPQVFKIYNSTNLSSGLVQTDISNQLSTYGIIQKVGGLEGGRMWVNISTGQYANSDPGVANGGTYSSYQNWTEFLGFSRIDGFPMFKAYRQANAVGYG